MTNIHVTYDDLRTAADRLTAGQSDIDDRLNELKSFIDNLVSGGYVTTASSGAFQDQYGQFTVAAKQTNAAIEGLSGFLRSAADSLQQTDESLASAIRGA